MTTQAERALQAECAWRLNALPVAWAAIPNGIYLPAHNDGERALVGRLVRRLKTDGMLTSGAADLIITGAGRALWVELKRPVSRDLFGVRSRAGALSQAQKDFRARCRACGVPHVVARDWDTIRAALVEHGLVGAGGGNTAGLSASTVGRERLPPASEAAA